MFIVPLINEVPPITVTPQRARKRKDAMAGTPEALAGTGGTTSEHRPKTAVSNIGSAYQNSTRQYPQYPPSILILKKED